MSQVAPSCLPHTSCDTDGKLSEKAFTTATVETGNTNNVDMGLNYEELEHCQNESCSQNSYKLSTMDTNQIEVMTDEEHTKQVSNLIQLNLAKRMNVSLYLVVYICPDHMYLLLCRQTSLKKIKCYMRIQHLPI